MSNFGRTKNNRERLILKSFFRRLIFPERDQEIENLELKNSKLNGIIGSGGSSSKECSYLKIFGIFRRKHQRYEYEVKEIITRYSCNYAKTYRTTFNKPQLIGKVYLYNGKWYRIIR